MAKAHLITSVQLSPAEERRSRMLKYSISMGIRMVCIIAMLFVSGWWLLLCALGAIFLPYIAVVIANQAVVSRTDRHQRPASNALAPTVRVSAEDWNQASTDSSSKHSGSES